MNTFQKIPANKKSLAKRKLVCGVGINDALYRTKYTENNIHKKCPYYTAWGSMLERCYSKKFKTKNETYLDCTVCEEWLIFSNFRLWMEQQNWINKALDKDLLFKGNKIYSSKTCTFISQRINNVLNFNPKRRGKYLLGVSFDYQVNKFFAQCSDGQGKNKSLGRFSSEYEAHLAYCCYKNKLLINLASQEIDKDVKDALISLAETFIRKNV